MPYMVPSENGGKADVRWMALRKGEGGAGLLMQAETGAVFQVNAYGTITTRTKSSPTAFPLFAFVRMPNNAIGRHRLVGPSVGNASVTVCVTFSVVVVRGNAPRHPCGALLCTLKGTCARAASVRTVDRHSRCYRPWRGSQQRVFERFLNPARNRSHLPSPITCGCVARMEDMILSERSRGSETSSTTSSCAQSDPANYFGVR